MPKWMATNTNVPPNNHHIVKYVKALNIYKGELVDNIYYIYTSEPT